MQIMIGMSLSIFLASQLFAQKNNLFEKTFSAKDKVKLKLVLGTCVISKSADEDIHVRVSYTYDDEDFEIQVKEKSKTVYLQEKIYGENARGDSDWNLAIPDDTEIDFSTATGDLTIEGVILEIDGNSGTGDIHVENNENLMVKADMV